MINNLLDKSPSGGEQGRFPVQINEWIDPATGQHVMFDRGVMKPIASTPSEEELEGHAKKSEGPFRKLAHHVLKTGFAERYADDREPVEGLTYSA